MSTHPDFEELFRLLEENGVDYMIVGGYAVAFHGYPRFTKDIDVFFRASAANVSRIRQALVSFGFGEEDLPSDAFLTRGNVLTFGVTPTRIDLLNEIDGVTYDQAEATVVRGVYGKVNVTFIGLDALLKNKGSTPCAKDKGDVKELMGLEDATDE